MSTCLPGSGPCATLHSILSTEQAHRETGRTLALHAQALWLRETFSSSKVKPTTHDLTCGTGHDWAG